MRIIRRGDEGEAVRDVQHRLTDLGLRIDGPELGSVFGASTEFAVREFQRSRSLPDDGLVGPDTWSELVEAGFRLGDRTLYLRSPAFRGDDVRSLQRMLNALGFDAGKEDGIFGPGTSEAVRDFQRNLAESVDGIVGLDTVRALERMRPSPGAASRAVVREAEAMRTMESSLSGSTVAVDEAHEPEGGETDEQEAELTLALAAALVLELVARGARPIVLRAAGDNPTPSDRAQAANAAAADVCVSLHLGGPPGVRGSSCAYWGTSTTHSPAGRRLAELIQVQLVRRVELEDGGIRPLAISLLRETRMPAVLVEPASVTEHEPSLADPETRRRIAEAIAEGLDRFLRAEPSSG